MAFGLKFNAKGIVDCYEKDLESLPFGQKRDIEFRMIEGDFQIFEGKWSIEQVRFLMLFLGCAFLGLNFACYLTFLNFCDLKPSLFFCFFFLEKCK